MKSIFRYPGGKTRRAVQKWILSHRPAGVREYREPFVGGGGIFFAVEPADVERRWINDANDGLVAVYRALAERPEAFIALCRETEPAREDDPLTEIGVEGGKPQNARLKKKFDEVALNTACNLTPEQTSYYRGLRYQAEKTVGHGKKSGGQSDPQKTAERLAAECGVSAKTIRRDAGFAQAVEQDTQGGDRKSKGQSDPLKDTADRPKKSGQSDQLQDTAAPKKEGQSDPHFPERGAKMETKRLQDWCDTVNSRHAAYHRGRGQLPHLPGGGEPELRLAVLRKLLAGLELDPEAAAEQRTRAGERFAADNPPALADAVRAALDEAAALLAAGTEAVVRPEDGEVRAYDGYFVMDLAGLAPEHLLHRHVRPDEAHQVGSFHYVYLGDELLGGKPLAFYPIRAVVELTKERVEEARVAAERKRQETERREALAEERRRREFGPDAVLSRIARLEAELAALRG